MKIPKIILSKPKIVFDCRCPKCRSLDIVASPSIRTTCKNCGTEFSNDAGINIYQTVAKKIIQLISHHNEIRIQGVRDSSDIHNTEDMLKPKTKHEDDVYHTLLAIKNNFEQMKCWVVSEISIEEDAEYYKSCSECAYCANCVQCKDCNHIYEPRLIRKERRYTCPQCRSKNYKQTHIEKLPVTKKCPHCQAKKISRVKLPSDLQQCVKCGSKQLTKPKKINVYQISIKRQKRFEL